MQPSFNLITYKKSNAFWNDTIIEFENVVLNDPLSRKIYNRYILFGRILRRLLHYRYLNRILSIFRLSQKRNFIILMGPHFHNCLPYFHTTPNNSIYLFDAWPENHHLIFQALDSFPVKNIFVSSSAITEMLQKRNKKCNFIWMPEGIDTDQYKFRAYKNKDIDIISIGRKYKKYEEMVSGILDSQGKKYAFDDFSTRQSFIDALSRSKISICIPRCIIDPEHTNGVPTMTIRYLQSIASKCLILGSAPQEMIDLFGYNPVIEIDNNDPQKQIIDILDNFDAYIPVIERNYEHVKQHHTWFHRFQEIKKYL
jgi:hypothetical protein